MKTGFLLLMTLWLVRGLALETLYFPLLLMIYFHPKKTTSSGRMFVPSIMMGQPSMEISAISPPQISGYEEKPSDLKSFHRAPSHGMKRRSPPTRISFLHLIHLPTRFSVLLLFRGRRVMLHCLNLYLTPKYLLEAILNQTPKQEGFGVMI